MPVDVSDLMDDYGRRTKGVGTTHGENLSRLGSWTLTGAKFGGVGAGVGAAAAGIAALFGKKAPTARTDFAVDDARDAISRAYLQYLGRPASDQELLAQIQGQGWKPGHRYVGEGGLKAVLSSIAQSPEAAEAAKRMPTMGGFQPTAGNTTRINMTPDRQAFMDSLRAGSPNRSALLAQLKG